MAPRENGGGGLISGLGPPETAVEEAAPENGRPQALSRCRGGVGRTRRLQAVGLCLQLTFPLLSSRGPETPLTPRFYKPSTKL